MHPVVMVTSNTNAGSFGHLRLLKRRPSALALFILVQSSMLPLTFTKKRLGKHDRRASIPEEKGLNGRNYKQIAYPISKERTS
jgi:hypothetical protein